MPLEVGYVPCAEKWKSVFFFLTIIFQGKSSQVLGKTFLAAKEARSFHKKFCFKRTERELIKRGQDIETGVSLPGLVSTAYKCLGLVPLDQF